MNNLVIFDIDGTLVKWHSSTYAWEFLLDNSGVDAWNKKAKSLYNMGSLTYEDWHIELIQKMREFSITEQTLRIKMLKKLAADTPSVSLVSSICNRFRFTAILSGSLTLALEVANLELSSFDLVLAHKLGFNVNGYIDSWLVNAYGTHEGKVQGLYYISSKLQVSLANIVYIGDGHNDRLVINELNRAGGMGIALPPLADSPQLLLHPHKRVDSFANLLNTELIC